MEAKVFLDAVSFPVFLMAALSPQAFELATGDYLFEPHSGEDYSRDEGIVGTSSSCSFWVVFSSKCTALILNAIFLIINMNDGALFRGIYSTGGDSAHILGQFKTVSYLNGKLGSSLRVILPDVHFVNVH